MKRIRIDSMAAHVWKTSKRTFGLSKRPLVMAILNVTPDSFSDGGRFLDTDDALRQAEKLIQEGADILDIGGESSRPGSSRVAPDEEIERVVPVIREIASRLDIAISVDTTKIAVAEAAIEAGAEIVNDISGLRFEPGLAKVAATSGAGLVLMHSRGPFEEMHSQPPVPDIFADLENQFRRSLSVAARAGVCSECIAIDVGIGFGKTLDQNLQLIAQLRRVTAQFPGHPTLVGASRKSFIGKILGGETPAAERLSGSLAAAAVAAWNGANILRVHDVAETAETLKVITALSGQR